MSLISYEVKGKGPAVILVHGFPMNHEVWIDWSTELAKDFTVYMPDLPGFGKSEILPEGFSLRDVAAQLLAWMSDLGIQKAVLIGHSLGGYVALNMVQQQPSMFRGLVLFHSTALADGSEKKESRTKVINFIEEKGVEAFTSNFITPLFANPQHPAIPVIREMNMKSSKEAVQGYTIAMRDRPDTTEVLKSYRNKVLFLAGEKDPGIPVQTIMDQARLGTHIRVEVLKNTGHMGMFEAPGETLTIVKTFIFNL